MNRDSSPLLVAPELCDVPDIAYLPPETRKAIYDRLDPDRVIASKIWNGEDLSDVELFVAFALGYLMRRRRKA